MPSVGSGAPAEALEPLVGAGHLDEETVRIILRSTSGIDMVVVGGQALNLLAEIFHARAPDELAAYAPYTSKDLDYWGMPEAARSFADRIGGSVYFPPPGDMGPSTAQVVFEHRGRRVEVDFLATIAGIRRIDPLLDTIEIELTSADPENDVRISVLRPTLVLESRLANIAILGRTDANTIRQAQAAVIVAREAILQILEENLEDAPDRPPREAIQAVIELGRIVSGRSAFEAWRKAGIDPVRILEDIARRDEWHPMFRERQILGRVERTRAAWKRRRVEMSRKTGTRDRMP